MGSHRDDTQPHKSLEEAILEKIDEAAATAEEPARLAFDKLVTIKRLVVAHTIFVLAFSSTMVYALIRVDDIADQNQQYLIDGCASSNIGRANELGFWLGLLQESAKEPDNQTPAKKAQLKGYEKKLYETYPQLDCTKVKDGERVVIPPKVK